MNHRQKFTVTITNDSHVELMELEGILENYFNDVWATEEHND